MIAGPRGFEPRFSGFLPLDARRHTHCFAVQFGALILTGQRALFSLSKVNVDVYYKACRSVKRVANLLRWSCNRMFEMFFGMLGAY